MHKYSVTFIKIPKNSIESYQPTKHFQGDFKLKPQSKISFREIKEKSEFSPIFQAVQKNLVDL